MTDIRIKKLHNQLAFGNKQYLFIGFSVRICIFKIIGQKAYLDVHTDIIVDKYICTYVKKAFYISQDFLYGPPFLNYNAK